MFWQLATLLLFSLCVNISCHYIPMDSYGYEYNPFSYGYDVEDNYGNKQWRQEKSINPMEVHGSYGYRDVNGIYREVVYVADKDGFRANVRTNEPGVATNKDPAAVKMESHHPALAYKQVGPSSPNYYNRKA